MPEPFIPYILMHKNIPVAELTLDTASGAIVSIGAVWESAHVPVGIPVRKQTIDRGALNEWWWAIRASSFGIREEYKNQILKDMYMIEYKEIMLLAIIF